MAPERTKVISKNHASILLANAPSDSASSKKSKKKALKKARAQGSSDSSSASVNISTVKSDVKPAVSVSDIDDLFATATKKAKFSASSIIPNKSQGKNKELSKKRDRRERDASDSDEEGIDNGDDGDYVSDSEEDDGGWEPIDDDEDEDSRHPNAGGGKSFIPGDPQYGIIKSNSSRPAIINPEAPVERIDRASGLPVYKAHLLKIGEGGGTPLCPFDCNCCF